MKINKDITLIVLFLLTLLFSCLTFHYCTSSPPPTIQTDTVYHTVHDTITTIKVINHTKHHYDTIIISDTVYIKDIPQLYQDSTEDYNLSINAVKLYDYTLSLYKDTVFIETTKPVQVPQKYKMGQSLLIGVQVGYGLSINPLDMKSSFSPYIGLGISYGFGISW